MAPDISTPRVYMCRCFRQNGDWGVRGLLSDFNCYICAAHLPVGSLHLISACGIPNQRSTSHSSVQFIRRHKRLIRHVRFVLWPGNLNEREHLGDVNVEMKMDHKVTGYGDVHRIQLAQERL
jgi:hypothetical protein